MSTDIESWRGVAAEGTDDLSVAVSVRLRDRSRKLLRSLMRRRVGLMLITTGLLLSQNLTGLAGPYLVQVGIDSGIPRMAESGDSSVLIGVTIAFAVVTLIEYLAKRGFWVTSGKLGQAVLLDLRRRVYQHFQRLSLSFHEKYTSGRVISRLTSDVDALTELVDGGLDELVMAALNIVSIAIVLLVLDWRMALVALASFPLLLWLSAWFRKHSTTTYRRTRETIALVIVHFVESLGGIRAVQAFRREQRNDEILRQLNTDFKLAQRRSMRLVAFFAPGIEVIGNITTVAVLIYGSYRVLRGDAEVGVLAAFLLYLRRFFGPMRELSMFYTKLQSATAALEKLSGVLEEEPEVAEPTHPTELPHSAGHIEFRGVHFEYLKDRPVLHTMELDIPAGQTVAVVGATGAGKTTIARLVARFYDPTAGSVLLDGINLRELSEDDLRRAVVTVTQENFLFAGTVADNIGFGRPGASREEIVAAAQAIGADEFIRALPGGYDTDIRKRGGRLSAGQRQLVAFARAFLADPAVLILDEATSSLDVPSERLVQRALRTILADRTAIIIAHRLSTVEIADRVLVLDSGRIIEDGTPEQLIDSGGRYATLHQQWAESLV